MRSRQIGIPHFSRPQLSEFGENTMPSGSDAEADFHTIAQWGAQVLATGYPPIPNADVDWSGKSPKLVLSGESRDLLEQTYLSRQLSTATTNWLPLIPQDLQESISGDTELGVSMSVGIERFTVNGSDVIRNEVVTELKNGGFYRLSFRAIGSCYVGARQYWGRQTKGTAFEMGDIYE